MMSMILNLLIGVATIFVSIEVVNLVRSLRAAKWKTAKGKIEDWDIHYSTDSEGTNLTINKLQYSYSVAGQNYLSSRVGFGFPWIMDSLFVGNTIEKILESAPELKIYYNPKVPSESTLVVGMKTFHAYKIFIYGIILSFLCGEANAL